MICERCESAMVEKTTTPSVETWECPICGFQDSRDLGRETTMIPINNDVLQRIKNHLERKETFNEFLTRVMDSAAAEGQL